MLIRLAQRICELERLTCIQKKEDERIKIYPEIRIGLKHERE